MQKIKSIKKGQTKHGCCKNFNMNISETSPRKVALFKAGLDVIIQNQGSKI